MDNKLQWALWVGGGLLLSAFSCHRIGGENRAFLVWGALLFGAIGLVSKLAGGGVADEAARHARASRRKRRAAAGACESCGSDDVIDKGSFVVCRGCGRSTER